MGSKNASKSKEKKRQNRKNKQESLKAVARASEAMKKVRSVALLGKFKSEEYEFWLANGVNYIMSDYETGTWTPLFPEIYNEDFSQLSRSLMISRITKACFDENGATSVQGTRCLSWVSLKPNELYKVVCKVQSLARISKANMVKPHNAKVWGAIEDVVDLVSKILDKAGFTSNGVFKPKDVLSISESIGSENHG